MNLVFKITETPQGNIEIQASPIAEGTEKERVYARVVREVVMMSLPKIGAMLGAKDCIQSGGPPPSTGGRN